MPALEPLRGIRVVADPAALDAARWSGEDLLVLRFAPDEAFGIGATGVDLDDDDGIVLDEGAFVGGTVPLDMLAHRLEWAIPAARPALAQGALAWVPIKLWLPDDGPTGFLVAYAASAPELLERLGWDR